MNPKNNIYHDF